MAQLDHRTQDFASRVEGADSAGPAATTTSDNSANKTNNATAEPFGTQRTSNNNNPFSEPEEPVASLQPSSSPKPPQSPQSPSQRDRRLSKEWDASKVPPSRFQKREGSLYATPGSRDGHVSKNKQQQYHEKLKEKGWN